MREIKFRAWEVETKEMSEVFAIDDITESGGLVFSRDGKDYISIFREDSIIEQFTGLKDKNGKEIYEGDILGGLYAGGYIGWCERCKQFQYFGCKDECFACGGDVHWSELSVEKELEVIGNIHENPELLN